MKLRLLGPLEVDDGTGWHRPTSALVRGLLAVLIAERGAPLSADLLAEALALWRGPAFTGVRQAPTIGAAAERLQELWLATVETRIEADLALGRHELVIAELHELTGTHLFRERLWAAQLVALYRTGRQADALATYQRLHRMLDRELGLEPGSAVQELHQRILRADPNLHHTERMTSRTSGSGRGHPSLPQPRQLPPGIADFTGRVDQIDRLDEALEASDGGPAIVVIDGPGGVGKTAPAVHWAHRVAARFPDGQFYVDLRGYAADPRTPLEVLASFLRASGIPPDRIPVDVDEATALLRSTVADHRVLFLLDNAYGVEQVRPLLPGDGGVLTIVTSRDRLTGLVAREAAHRLDLGRLTAAERGRLLEQILGPERVAAESDEAAELAQLCDHLPLALRIAAADLVAEPDVTIAATVADLRAGDRLELLDVPGDSDSSLRSMLDQSYLRLSDHERRCFRLLALAPGSTFSVRSAGRMAEVDDPGRMLRRLTAAHLLEQPEPGRYGFHDLIRMYAARRAREEDAPATRARAVAHALWWYLGRADAAVALVQPHFTRLPVGIESTGVMASASRMWPRRSPGSRPSGPTWWRPFGPVPPSRLLSRTRHRPGCWPTRCVDSSSAGTAPTGSPLPRSPSMRPGPAATSWAKRRPRSLWRKCTAASATIRLPNATAIAQPACAGSADGPMVRRRRCPSWPSSHWNADAPGRRSGR